MANASDYWAGVTDGDGNGQVGLSSDNSYQASHIESRLFFWHLSSAKLVKGDFDGTWAIEQGYPRLKIDSNKGLNSGGWITNGGFSDKQLTSERATKSRVAGIHLEIARPAAPTSDFNNEIGTMTVLQTYTIDNKIDDGVAISGIFQAYRTAGSTQGNCLTGNDGNYLMTAPDNMACMGLYILEK